ncbi:MAG: cbb3-type cytochrome c oxidase subunit 3 [Hyphomicrobiales bacterium]|jgi:cytochrome c oxidase cbb3-type subunit IV
MSYDTIRHFADSWALLIMFGCFIAVVFYAFRPGSRKIYDEVARIPLENDPKD